MDKYGLIHEKLDIKILILYILNRLPEAVDGNTLAELCQCDAGVGYFEYSECLAELVDTGHAEKLGDSYRTTEKGRRNGTAIESSIPYTVREKADRALAPVALAQRRQSMITTGRESGARGGVTVSLAMSDGVSEIISLRLLAPDEATAKAMEKRFRADAEGIYGKITELLTEKEENA